MLGRLGFFTAGSGPVIKVAIPTWRPDVHGKADIVEEVVRIIGVDRVPMTPFERGDDRAQAGPHRRCRTAPARPSARSASRGLVEAITWSFVSKPQAELFGGGKAELALANPIAADLSDMRPSLIPGLVAAAQKNADRGYPDTALFEVGQIFRGDRPQDQLTAASGVRRGLAKASGAGRHWATGGKSVDAYDVKADALAVLAAAGAPMQALADRAGRTRMAASGAQRHHPDRPAERARLFRRAASAARSRRSAPRARWWRFEVVLDRIPEPKAKPTRAKPLLELSPFQPVERDFAFIVDRTVKAADIVRAAQGVDRKLITGIAVFDVYEGAGIDPDKKSIAIAVTLQPREKTMTDQEIDAVAAKIVAEVGKRTGGVLRG